MWILLCLFPRLRAQTAGPDCGNRSLTCGVRTDAAVICDAAECEREGGGTYHPRGDRKSSEAIVIKRDSHAPLRERVRKRMETLSLEGCNRKERTWAVLVSQHYAFYIRIPQSVNENWSAGSTASDSLWLSDCAGGSL
jgi:hypothetical protein